MKETAVELVHVIKRFAEVVAVNDVSLMEIYSRMWTEIKTE